MHLQMHQRVLLCDVGDLHAHHLLNLLAVQILELTKTSNIKRLEEVI